MDAVVFVEVLGRHGEVTARIRLDTLPATVGRSYDNAVVVDDPYLAGQHARIDRGPGGALELVDLGTKNGLRVHGARRRLDRTDVDPAAHYLLGRTRIRIRTSAHPVEPERPEDDHGARRHWVLALALVVASAAVGAWQVWIDTFTKPELPALLAPALWIVPGIVVWAGLWAFAGKVFTGLAGYPRHLALAALFVIGLYLLDFVQGALAFALSQEKLLDVLHTVAFGLALAALLYAHLRLASHVAARRAATTALVIGALVAGGLDLSFRAMDAEQVARMDILEVVLPPSTRLVDAAAPSDFFEHASQLAGELGRLRADSD